MEHFTGERGETDAFGNGKNTQAHRINSAMCTIPQTLTEISLKSGVGNIGRIGNHMRWLCQKNLARQVGEGWALTDNGEHLLRYKSSYGSKTQNVDGDLPAKNPRHSHTHFTLSVDKATLFSCIDEIIKKVNLYKTTELDEDLAERSRWNPSENLADKEILKIFIGLVAYSQRTNSQGVSNLIKTGVLDEMFLDYDPNTVAVLNVEILLKQYWDRIGALWKRRSKVDDMVGCAKALIRIQKQHGSFMAYIRRTRVPIEIMSESDIEMFWNELKDIQSYFQKVQLPLFGRLTSLCHLLMTLGYACVKPDSAVMAAATKLGMIPARNTRRYSDVELKQVVRTMQEYCLDRQFNIRILDRYLLIFGGQLHARTLVSPYFYN